MKILLKKRIRIIIIGLLLVAGGVLSINEYVKKIGTERIIEAKEASGADAVLILGARVFSNGGVSLMLKDRLTVGYELYATGKVPKILVSGDHGQKEYDEVNTMKEFLKKKGVPAEDIFMDHAGFNTYDSIYRARDIFQVKKVIIVTQEYHLMRALFIARELGLDAYGVVADQHHYPGVMLRNEIREIAARNKDFFLAKFLQPKPRFLGEVIPVTGDGGLTDDKVQ